MKVAGLVILAAIALAVLTGSCSGGEFSVRPASLLSPAIGPAESST